MQGIRGFLFVLVITLLALLPSCGQHSNRDDASSTGVPQRESATHFSLDSALSELNSYGPPEGVDPTVFSQIKAALKDALIARREGKLTCTPPSGTGNAVTDLDLIDAGGGTADLTWHYYNLGDYDQNSVVNVADITPI